MARKKSADRAGAYSPTLFRRTLPQTPDAEAGEIVESLRIASAEAARGHSLPKRLSDELMRFLRAHRKRLNANVIVNMVSAFALKGLPVSKGSAKGETAFDATARTIDKHIPGITAENIARIYYQAIDAYVPKRGEVVEKSRPDRPTKSHGARKG